MPRDQSEALQSIAKGPHFTRVRVDNFQADADAAETPSPNGEILTPLMSTAERAIDSEEHLMRSASANCEACGGVHVGQCECIRLSTRLPSSPGIPFSGSMDETPEALKLLIARQCARRMLETRA